MDIGEIKRTLVVEPVIEPLPGSVTIRENVEAEMTPPQAAPLSDRR